MSTSHEHKKTLGLWDAIFYTISAMLLLDQLVLSATLGTASLSWWIILLFFYFIPSMLIISELGTTFPEQGGIYAWIRDAFGPNWAMRVTWFYWVNITLWIPSTLMIFSGMFSALFFPEMSLVEKVMLAIACTWILIYWNVMPLSSGKWFLHAGTVMKLILFAVLGIGSLQYVSQHGHENGLSIQALMPSLDSGMVAVPVIIYGMLGFELVACSSGEMKKPEVNVARATFISGVIIIALYMLCVVGIMAAVPQDEISLYNILDDTLKQYLGGSLPGRVLATALVICALYTLVSTLLAWTIAANRVAAKAAEEKELPEVFGIIHKKNDTPVGAALLLGLLSTVVILIYALLATSAEELFWNLFSAGAVVFLLPYVGVYFAFIKLRKIYPERRRPFRIWGPDSIGDGLALLCNLLLIGSISLLIWTPGEQIKWEVIAGVLVVLFVGEVIRKRAVKMQHKGKEADKLTLNTNKVI